VDENDIIAWGNCFQDPLTGSYKTVFKTPSVPKYEVGGFPSEDLQVNVSKLLKWWFLNVLFCLRQN